MVNRLQRLGLLGTLALLSVSLSAKELSAYRVGDKAEEDITAAVALDVIDPDATAARRAAEAARTPVIFREFPDSMTNALTAGFLNTFKAAHTAFLAALQKTFNATTLNEDALSSPDFEKFLADFNKTDSALPVNHDLAQSWAGGDSGDAIAAKYLDALLAMTHRAIRADDLPAGFTVGESLRVVNVADPQAKLTLADADQRGKLITASGLTTVSRLRSLFRRNFPDDQQNLARALQVFLQPNCAPEPALSQQSRDRAASQLVIAAHYDAGQTVIRRGETVDAKTQAALSQLDEKLAPQRLNQQLAAERERGQQQQLQAQQARDRAAQAGLQARRERDNALAAQNQALKTREHNLWLVIGMAGVSAVALLAVFIVWRRARRTQPAMLPPARAENILSLSPQLMPQITEALREAVVQGLATQRKELLQAQQIAAAEIQDLVRRLDTLQAPLHERVRSYETRIGELEKELAARTEENRELLKLKIEMMRRQLDLERARNPRFN